MGLRGGSGPPTFTARQDVCLEPDERPAGIAYVSVCVCARCRKRIRLFVIRRGIFKSLLKRSVVLHNAGLRTLEEGTGMFFPRALLIEK